MQQATSFAYTSLQRTPVSRSTFQLMLSYQLGRGWYMGSSHAIWTSNLRHSTSITIPQRRTRKVWNLSKGEAFNGSVAGEWMAYWQFAPRAEPFTLKFQVTLLFPTVELGLLVLHSACEPRREERKLRTL